MWDECALTAIKLCNVMSRKNGFSMEKSLGMSEIFEFSQKWN